MSGKNRLRTLRGQLGLEELRQLVVDDGQLNQGYRVTKFEIFPHLPAGATQLTAAILGLDFDMDVNMNAGDNRQIGWAFTGYSAGALAFPTFTTLDPDHVIIRDLYIKNTNEFDRVNYIIELETVNLTDDQTILTLIKERSQDDSR